ncbi:MBL fold metallo-hydrolase [Parafrankia soli]|uniref:MBL fold metallo-hydrolase n=1 Tax=Parafrankia soli TaxID=2599596 RepID=UPI003B5862CC
MTSANQPVGWGLPPVERLRPGLWSIPVPLPTAGLRHVFVYLFETERGAYVVDSGWDTEEAFAAVEAGLAVAGYSIGELRGIMATHMHPDHYGLAVRLREASGAWVSLHAADADLIRRRPSDLEVLSERTIALFRRAGAPAEDVDGLVARMTSTASMPDAALPDILLEDGERPDVPGWELRTIWTPGHSPGHLCFWEPFYRLLLSGDHVLPRITPNIPFHTQADDDPLGDYLASLDKLADLPVEEVLPAHEYRFVDHPGRIAALKRHHGERFAEVLTALRDGAASAWDIGRHMTWSSPWDKIEGFMKRAAVAEALAHLRALERRGLVRERGGDPPSWELLVG